jgi:hypothetical protein
MCATCGSWRAGFQALALRLERSAFLVAANRWFRFASPPATGFQASGLTDVINSVASEAHNQFGRCEPVVPLRFTTGYRFSSLRLD